MINLIFLRWLPMSVAPVWIIKQSSSRYQWIQSHDFVIPIYHDGKIYWWRGTIKSEKLCKGGMKINVIAILTDISVYSCVANSPYFFHFYFVKSSEFQCSVWLWELNLAMLVYTEPFICLSGSGFINISNFRKRKWYQWWFTASTTSTISIIELGPVEEYRGAQWRTN